MKKIFLILFLVFSFNIKASAASSCSYEEQTNLNSKAANIKVSYEVVEEIVHNEDMDTTKNVFDISIFNITEEFYVIVKNNINLEELLFSSNDTNGDAVKFRWDNLQEVTNFTIQVYTSENASCPHEKYKTIYLTTPRYNIYYDREICAKLNDFYLCEQFVTFDEIEEDEFLNKLESYRKEEINNVVDNIYKKEEPKNTSDKIFGIIDNYKWYIIGGLSLIFIIIVIIRRNHQKKQRDLGL